MTEPCFELGPVSFLFAVAACSPATERISGEGDYLEIKPEPGDWPFGGAEADVPKIMDDALTRLTGAVPIR